MWRDTQQPDAPHGVGIESLDRTDRIVMVHRFGAAIVCGTLNRLILSTFLGVVKGHYRLTNPTPEESLQNKRSWDFYYSVAMLSVIDWTL